MVDAAAAVNGGGSTPTPPVAAFTGTPVSGESPLTVYFTDQSTNSPTSWSWTFGDGGTSAAQNPNHTYTAAGTYSVSLTVTNADGSDSLTRTNYIAVTDPPAPLPPVAAFTANTTSGDAPLTVQFTDQSTNEPTGWSWAFGDGGTSTARNPSHAYAEAGVYTVTLTASNAYGSDAETKTGYITVSEPPVGGTLHVADMNVYRVPSGRKYYGKCDVTILDAAGAPVSGAAVYVSYTGTNSGNLVGTTGTNGVASFTTVKSTASVDFCFTVTNVTHASLTYDPAANLVTQSCEGGDVYGASSRLADAALLLPNAPNPFNPMTEIAFSLPRSLAVRLTVYNARGEVQAVLVDGTLEAGVHSYVWTAGDAPSGVYFSQLIAEGETQTQKMILIK
jgi:PKD repeat protein